MLNSDDENQLVVVNQDNWLASFVNTKEPPDKKTYLDIYNNVNEHNDTVDQLVIYEYLINDIYWLSIYKWERMKLKKNTASSVALICNAMVGIKELILEVNI